MRKAGRQVNTNNKNDFKCFIINTSFLTSLFKVGTLIILIQGGVEFLSQAVWLQNLHYLPTILILPYNDGFQQ